MAVRGGDVVIGTALAAAAALIAALSAAPASVAAAPPAPATVTTVVQGQIVRLVSTQQAAAASMQVGVPVHWDVEVSASRDDGVIDVSLTGTAGRDAFAVTARECDTAWTDTGCTTGERMLGTAAAGQALALGTQSSAAIRWYRIEVVLLRALAGTSATLEFHADGEGGTAAASQLPSTGGAAWPLFAPAVVAVGAGVLIAAIARRRRDRST